jgi:hypothetical protein
VVGCEADVSAVLRDMLINGSLPPSAPLDMDPDTKANTEISFIDPAIESSNAVYHFFSFIIGKSLPCPTTTSLETVEQLLEFVNKYDCGSAILTFTHLLKSFIHPSINPRALLALAATHDALEVCVEVIKTSTDWVYDAPKDRENEDLGQVVGGNVLDPSAMAWSDACTIPEKYYWGLVRAFRVVEEKVVKKEDWVKIGDEFERVMKGQAGESVA